MPSSLVPPSPDGARCITVSDRGATLSSSIFSLLEVSLHEYLTAVTGCARHANDRTAANLARDELPRIAAALRAVLDEHELDARGRCESCRTRRFGRFGRAPAPCRAYLTAHLCLMVERDDSPSPRDGITAADLRHTFSAPG